MLRNNNGAAVHCADILLTVSRTPTGATLMRSDKTSGNQEGNSQDNLCIQAYILYKYKHTNAHTNIHTHVSYMNRKYLNTEDKRL
jgi:hypothetical protein